MQSVSRQSPTAFFGLREREHLRVRRGVLEQFHLVEGAGDDASFAHDDRADGHFARFISLGRLPQRLAHEIIVAVQINDGIVIQS